MTRHISMTSVLTNFSGRRERNIITPFLTTSPPTAKSSQKKEGKGCFSKSLFGHNIFQDLHVSGRENSFSVFFLFSPLTREEEEGKHDFSVELLPERHARKAQRGLFFHECNQRFSFLLTRENLCFFATLMP